MKKSVVLPYDRYQQLIQNKKEPPVETSVNLELAQAIEPPHTTTLKSPLSKEKLSSSVIIACLPKKSRNKAQQLLDYIEKYSKLDWNQTGNLVVEDKPVEFSHIVDLLHDALNQTKNQPVGHETFYRELEHVPLSLINNFQRRSLIGGGGSLPPPGLPATEPKPLNIWKANWKPL